jgi:hypothetical protein
MKSIIVVASLVLLSSPALAQGSIGGVELSSADAARVQRQCDVLKIKEMRSLASDAPDEPLPGQIVSDPASYWADGANEVDQIHSKVNLNALTLRDCRKAGFY